MPRLWLTRQRVILLHGCQALRFVLRRYFFTVAALNASTAQAWIDNAFYAETAQVAGYIANGGLPLVVSEWTLAGARARGA